MRKHLKTSILSVFIMLIMIGTCTTQALSADMSEITADRTSIVIYMYTRIGEDEYPDTNITQEQFISHIEEITTGDYEVMSVPDALKAMKAKKTLPKKAIAITFDGGYKSVYEHAIPILERHNMPYTIFIPTDHIDSKNPQYMSWSELRKVSKSNLSTIGIMPASYTRLYAENEAEIKRQVNKARARFREELKHEAQYFAYPFGEYNKAYQDIIAKSGFTATFGQQSSVAFEISDTETLPRFAMTESFGNVGRFRLLSNALPLPVHGFKPDDRILTHALSHISFTVDDKFNSEELENLSCFLSGHGKVELSVNEHNHVDIIINPPGINERMRLNCTLPVTTKGSLEDKKWRWFGELFILPYKEYQPKDNRQDD